MTAEHDLTHNEEYLQHHPAAIADKDKAWYMAHGTKELEIMANELGKQALDMAVVEATAVLGEQHEAPQEESSIELRIQATAMRKKADDAASNIGKTYDTYMYAKGSRKFPSI